MNTLENGVFRKNLLGLLEKAGNGNMCPVSKRSHRPISGLDHYGFPQVYGNKYMDEDDPFAYKIDCILFAADDDCIASLNDQCRKYIVGKSEQLKKQYSDIIAEESQRADFVCWLRNPPRGKWSLCIPYEMSGERKATYPDFLIVRSDPALDYIIDILEPHNPDFKDNLGKAKAFARYAEAEPRIGRIQLIRTGKDAAGKHASSVWICARRSQICCASAAPLHTSW